MSSPTQGRGAEGELGSIGPYTLVSEIARGDLALVYLATRALPAGGQRRAVFKVLRPELRGDPAQQELLDHEARVMAALHHPNVAAVLPDAPDTPGAVPYEYVDGETLAALLARVDASLKPKLLIPIFSDVLRGLASAHGALSADGEPLYLVHQAPCARHIVVGTDGGSRLIDFSQSLSLDATASRARADRLRVAYMAPEQALDPDNVDARADLFVLGITLWEALTGEPLFTADDAAQTFQNMLHREVPKPSSVGRRPPPAFDAVCLRALERPRERRYSTAGEMLAALAEVGRSVGGAASAFEVGQWVMALAGATLRARHGKARSPSTAPRAGSVPAPSGRPIVVARPPKAASTSTAAGTARPPETGPAADPPSVAPAPLEPAAAPPVQRLNTPLPPTPGAYGAASKLSSADAPLKRDIRSHLPPPSDPQRPSLGRLTPVPEDTASAAPEAAREPAATRPPESRSARPSEGGVGFATVPGGFVGGVPVVATGTPAPPSPSGRQRVRTLQSLAAVSVAPPATVVGDGQASSPARGASRSDSPTEVLSTEQAQQLSALAAAAGEKQAEARGQQGDGGRGRFGRATEELYSMPPRAGGSVPDETVVGDRAALEQEARASVTVEHEARARASARPLSSTLIGAVAPASLRTRRPPEDANDAPSATATTGAPGSKLAVASPEPEAGSGQALAVRSRRAPSEAGALASYSPGQGFPRGLDKLFFVPPVEEDSPFPGDSGRPSAPTETQVAGPLPAESTPPVPRRWGWLALVAALLVAVAVLYLNAQNGEAPAAPDDARAELAPSVPAPPPDVPAAAPVAPIAPPSSAIAPITRTLPPAPSSSPAPTAPGAASASEPGASPEPTASAPSSSGSRGPASPRAGAASSGASDGRPTSRAAPRPEPVNATREPASSGPSATRAAEPAAKPASTAKPAADKPAADKPAAEPEVEVPSNPY